jgi:hypothetical protein
LGTGGGGIRRMRVNPPPICRADLVWEWPSLRAGATQATTTQAPPAMALYSILKDKISVSRAIRKPLLPSARSLQPQGIGAGASIVVHQMLRPDTPVVTIPRARRMGVGTEAHSITKKTSTLTIRNRSIGHMAMVHLVVATQ